MADKQIGFVRVDEDTYAWLKATAADAGVPISTAARAIITQAMRNGWTIERGEPYRVVQPAPGPPPVTDPFGRQS